MSHFSHSMLFIHTMFIERNDFADMMLSWNAGAHGVGSSTLDFFVGTCCGRIFVVEDMDQDGKC